MLAGIERFFFFMFWVVIALIIFYVIAGFVRNKASGNFLGRFAGWAINRTEGV